MVDAGLDPQAAIDAPRFRRAPGSPSGTPDRVWLERRLAPRAAALRRLGYHVACGPDWDPGTGFAHALARTGTVDERLLLGGADPRGEGLALGG